METTADFDLDRYLRASKRVDLEGVAWDEIPNYPLSDDEIFCLHYMMDIETHTIVYLRDVLITPALLDPYVTAFLSCWVYEELWHGEAFSRVLEAYGVRASPPEPAVHALPSRPRRVSSIRERLGVGNKLGWLLTLAGTTAVKDFVAVHMTWGAINELTTLTAYKRMIATTKHPVLRDILSRIAKDERRHFAFYRAQARERLARSKRAQAITRWVMRRLWTPVGIGVKTEQELARMNTVLFSGADGEQAVRDIDRTIGDLPGLSGVSMLRRWQRKLAALPV